MAVRKFRLAALVFGPALLVWLIWRSRPAVLGADLVKVGWWMAVLVALAAARNATRAAAVHLALGEERKGFGFGAMYVVLLVSQAVQFAVMAGVVAGEATKGWMLSRRVPRARAASAVMVDILLYNFTAGLFALGAIGLLLVLRPDSSTAWRIGLVAAGVVAGAVIFGTIGFRRRWLGTKLGEFFAHCGIIPREEKQKGIEEVKAHTFGFGQRHPRELRRILAWNFASHFLSALEVMVILWLLGLGAGFGTAIVVEGLTKLVEIGSVVVPGDLGIYQGGTGLIFRAIGFTVSTGVSVGVIRQIRSILWSAVGLVVFLLLPRLAKDGSLFSRSA